MKKSISSFLKICSIFLVLLGFLLLFLISIAYKQVGIGALIAACGLIAIAIIGVAWITDIRKADLLKNGKIVSEKLLQ